MPTPTRVQHRRPTKRTFPVTSTHARLSKDEAQNLTTRIREQATVLWTLVTEAHDRKAWQALGYPTWRAYVTKELQMSPSRSYQLIDTGHVVRLAQQVLGVDPSNMLDIHPTAREAARAKDQLPLLRRELRACVKAGLEPREALRAAIKSLPAPVPKQREASAVEKVEVVEAVEVPTAKKGKTVRDVRIPQGMKLCPRCGGLGYV